MISRRNYLTIAILMFIVFFLCMFINSLKDTWNDYEENPYVESAEDYPSKVNVYVPESLKTSKAAAKKAVQKTAGGKKEPVVYTSRNKVIGIGDTESTLMKMTKEWVSYSKRDIALYDSLASYREAEDIRELAEMLVLDSKGIDWENEEESLFLMECVKKGTHLVFCNLPDPSVIRQNEQLREILGIQSVRKDKTTVDGIHLYGGFLLGGETFYQALEKEDKKYQDMELTFPWYRLSSGTKVYMKGIPEDESLDVEEHPVIIWRKSFGSAYVFAVNGGYMEGITGMGLLSAMSAEMYPYEIYPVVNAQNVVFTGYPGLADENGQEMEKLYSRSLHQVFQEIILPNMLTSLQDYQFGITCMLSLQYDYSDKNDPDSEQLKYYLKTFNEQSAEAGLSGISISSLPLKEKLAVDDVFFKEAVGGYDFSSFYAGGLSEKEIGEALKEDILSSVMTVVTDYDEEDVEIIKFLSEYVTAQSTLGDGLAYTYRGDFLMKSVETALGYFNTSFDMTRVAYPKSSQDSWEKLSKMYSKTVDTYGQTFDGFAKTTISESDTRIRRFLALDYAESRTDDTIHLKTEGDGKTAWYLLRTHNESVDEVEGGSFQELEEGVFLIETSKKETVIRLKPADERYYTMPEGKQAG